MSRHECEDAATYRKDYLKTVNSLHSSYLPLPPCSDVRASTPPEDAETRKKLVMIFHDESSFNISEGQGWIWGTGIMLSDFNHSTGWISGAILRGVCFSNTRTANITGIFGVWR